VGVVCPMKAAVKFCGGCNPAYDRADYWDRIRRASESRIEWVPRQGEDYCALMVICGCQTACPLREMSEENSVVLLTDDALPAEGVVSRIEECCG